MRNIIAFAVIAVVAGRPAFAVNTSTITYTLEIGGDNHVAAYENFETPAFTAGTIVPLILPLGATSVTWDARVDAGGTADVPGRFGGLVNVPIFGAAKLLFSLELRDSTNVLVPIGAASMVCDSGTITIDCLNAHPITGGFYSSINDGDKDGVRGAADQYQLAAFAYAWRVRDADPYARIFDNPFDNGPFMSLTSYPSVIILGRLAGMSAAYVHWGGNERAGVGILDAGGCGGCPCFLGTGPVAEGQISLIGLPFGDYSLNLVPEQGNNVLAYDGFCDNGIVGPATVQAATVTGAAVAFTIPVQSPVVNDFRINNGDAAAGWRAVTLNNACSFEPADYMASESPDFSGATWRPYSNEPPFMLSPPNGLKTVYFKVRNIFGESPPASDTITLAMMPVPGDFNSDGDVDMDDFNAFQACASGPAIPYMGDCTLADLNSDGDVDSDDFGVFQRCYSGAEKPANPNCAN